MSFFSKKDRGESVVVFHIGSGSVSGAIVTERAGNAPRIVYATKTRMVFERKLEFKRFSESMQIALSQTAADLAHRGMPALAASGGGHLREAHCFFSSPWHVCRSSMLSMAKKEPVTVTKSMIESLIGKEEDDFERVGIAKYAEQIRADVELVERKLVRVRLNGYETANPHGRTASEIELTLFMSMLGKSTALAARETIAKALGPRKAIFHSFGLAAFTVLRDLAGAENCILLDVGAEVTDVMVVGGGIPLETLSFPIGNNYLVRKAAERLETPPEEAATLMSLSEQQGASPDVAKAVDEILADAGEKWNKALDESLAKISEQIELPGRVLCIVEGKTAPRFLRFLNEHSSIDPVSMPQGGFTAEIIDGSLFLDAVENKSGAPLDPFVSIPALYLDKLLREE